MHDVVSPLVLYIQALSCNHEGKGAVTEVVTNTLSAARNFNLHILNTYLSTCSEDTQELVWKRLL